MHNCLKHGLTNDRFCRQCAAEGVSKHVGSVPAFPSIGFDETGQFPGQFFGMSQRQYYVGKLIQGVVAAQGLNEFGDAEIVRIFNIADQLIKFERDGK